MTILIVGLALWMLAHFLRRIAPGMRQNLQDRLGDGSKGIVALVILLAVVLMVIGYRGAETEFLWGRSGWSTGLNNLLMLVSVALFGVGSSKSRLRERMRHPMLTGMMVWAFAHLLVNGDGASILLFGGLFLWAAAEIILINRSEPDYQPFTGGSLAGDIRLGVISLVVFAVIAAIHTWLGYFPFGI